MVADSYGLIFGCSLAPQSAIYIAPVSSIPFIIFSGYLITIKNIPSYFKWMTYVSYYRYGFEGILKSIYHFNRTDFECSHDRQNCPFGSIKYINSHFSLELNYEIDIAVLAFFIVLMRISTLFVLWIKVRNSK